MGALIGGLPEARWVPRDQLHLTLRFIGEVEQKTFNGIREALAGVTGTPFTLTLAGIGHFPPGREPRVLWVGMEGIPSLLVLQEQVERAVVSAGIPAESRRFSPHITIARLKETTSSAISTFERRHAAFRTCSFPVDSFHLYSSTLTRNGAIHTRIASYSLSVKS